MKRALALMLNILGDQPIAGMFFRIDESPLSFIKGTTWIELRERGYVAPLFSSTSSSYALTGRGFLKALEVTGIVDDEAFQRNLGQLSRVLKSNVKGRGQPALVSVGTVVAESELSQAFVYNCIEGKVLDRVFKRRGADWASSFNGVIIIAQSTFGQEPVDF